MSNDNEMVKIEKGVPIPKRGGAGGNRKYPWLTMEVGDSFVMAGVQTVSIYRAVYAASIRTGRKFAARKIDGVHRVWRTA